MLLFKRMLREKCNLFSCCLVQLRPLKKIHLRTSPFIALWQTSCFSIISNSTKTGKRTTLRGRGQGTNATLSPWLLIAMIRLKFYCQNSHMVAEHPKKGHTKKHAVHRLHFGNHFLLFTPLTQLFYALSLQWKNQISPAI